MKTLNMAASEEHVLLERVFLRIGSAETDEQLQSALGKFLPPVLLKLSSQTDGVRKKVMELLVHINKRVKSRPKIQLPVNDLLAQYKDPEASPFVTNFTIIYIKMGYPRLETKDQLELLPEVIDCIEGRPVPQQDSLMQLIIPVLQHVKVPPDPAKVKQLFGLDTKPVVVKLMLEFMLDFLIMPYSTPAVSEGNEGASNAVNAPTAPGAPPGLSESAYKRVQGEKEQTPDEIEKIKIGILNFLGEEVVEPQLVVCHFIAALADSRHAVSSAADRCLKKVLSGVDWNNSVIVSKLYSIFQGTVVVKGQTTAVKPDKKRTPANIQMRLKIFPYLLRSRDAANQFPACVQTVFDCLYGTNTNGRLKIMAVQFVHHLSLNCSDAKFNPIGAVLLSGMIKLIGENKEDKQLRSLAYIAVAKIARRVPQLVAKDISLLQTFFDAMCKEESENRLAVQESLSMMSTAFKCLDTPNLKLVEALLMENIEKPEPFVRQMVVQYAIAVFPPDHIPSRYILLLACGDTKEDIYAEASRALRGESGDKDEVKKETEQKEEARRMPHFIDMVNYINDKATQRQKSASKYVVGSTVLAFNPATYVEILMYLRMCLANDAGVKPNLESTATMQEEAPRVGAYVRKLLEDKSKNVITAYISIIKKLLTAIGGSPAMYCLTEIVAVARPQLAPQFVKQLDWIKTFVLSSRDDMREYASQFYALIAFTDTSKRQIQILKDLLRNIDTQENVDAVPLDCPMCGEQFFLPSKLFRHYFMKYGPGNPNWTVEQYQAVCPDDPGFEDGDCYEDDDASEDDAGNEDPPEGASTSQASTSQPSTSQPSTSQPSTSQASSQASTSQASSFKGSMMQPVEGQHGCVLAVAYLIGLIFTAQRGQDGDVTVEEMDVDEEEETEMDRLINKAMHVIVSLLDNSSPILSGGACVALGEIGRCGSLPLPDTSTDGKKVSVLSVVEKLIKKLHSTKEPPKVREKAATALGNLCVGGEVFPHRLKVIEGLMDCAQPKQVELHFTVGEALVCAALGTASPEARDKWLLTAEDFKPWVGNQTLELKTVLNLLLAKYIPSPNPHIRQAACIWLMAIIRGGKDHKVIQSHLKDAQAAFMDLLSDNDELTQDFSSKGLAIVYEICGKEQKDELVSLLVSTLTTGKRQTERKVTGDTKVFEQGSLGKAPDGQGLSTYKELCAIATDLNQPDLIYKFMHLANHNAMWNSKKGAAFGFSTIAAQAGEQLAPYLDQIVPKLYRYQFDPNPRINQAMTSIWTALVTDSKKTIDKYLKEILDDLILNLTNSQWRVRESCCLAMNDVLRGRALDDVVDGLPQVWETLLRVRDDIKESVRKAADMACKTLSRVSIKICDPNYSSVGEKATSLVLPCLLKVGLPSQVQEIRALSLSTILKISQNAGRLLKPHVSLLVVALLESLSGLEPQYLNYLSLHAASSQVTQEKLDTARLAASKTSPMMQAVNQCVQYVDSSNLGELIPRLSELVRSGVGLGTKAGAANFIISLVHHCPRDLTPYAGKLLGGLLNGLSDRNATVKKSYASAIGYLAKVAKDSSLEKLVLRLKDWYFEKEDEGVRHACGLTLQAMGQKSPDALKRHATSAMPLAFLAMHEKNQSDDAEAAKARSERCAVWEEVWAECTPGTEGGIRMYIEELVAISKLALLSQSWPMKAQGAAAMKKMADSLGSNLGPPHLGMVLTALLEGLQGRTWTGKEELLKALAAICVNCKTSMDDSSPVEGQPTVASIVDAVLKECRKEKLTYKQEAVAALGAILEVQEMDRFEEIYTILNPLLDRKTEDLEDLDVKKDTLFAFQAVGYDCLGLSWPKSKETQEKYQVEICKLISGSLNRSVWKVEVAKLRTCNKILSNSLVLESGESIRANKETVESLIHPLSTPLCQALANVKYTSVRTEALSVSELIIKKLAGSCQLDLLSDKEMENFQKHLNKLTSDKDGELADRASQLLKLVTAAAGTSV